jgi:DNA mismatch endonuclease, patch repair protein
VTVARATSYAGFRPGSLRASAAARGASRKVDTKPELLLRRALFRQGLRYRKHVRALRGCPDIVFPGAKVAIFCDGDFWHGKDWIHRRRKLEKGTNSAYWISKIDQTMERDIRNQTWLEEKGWQVLRFWETEILSDPHAIVAEVLEALSKLEL